MLAIRSEEKGQHDRKGWPSHVTRGTMRVAIGASLLFLLLAAACGSEDPTATPVPEQPPGDLTFEQEWAQLIAAAQEEGELLMSVGPLGEYRDLWTFSKRHSASSSRPRREGEPTWQTGFWRSGKPERSWSTSA